MLTRKTILTMTTAAALCSAPLLAFGQQNTGGSSQIQGTTQTTPQQGTERGMPAARGAATSGSDTGLAPNASGNPGQRATSGADATGGRTTNPSGNATGPALQTDGGRGAATGAPGATTEGRPGPSQSQLDRIRQNEGNTTGADSRTGAAGSSGSNVTNAPVGNNLGSAPANRTDGTPGNPPSTATGRAADAATGSPTSPDGTGNNPPGTALGRALGTAPGSTAAGAGAATGAAATGATTGSMAVDSSRTQGGRRASKVIGSTVYNENNETVGEVEDIIIPAGGSQPVAVISVGGFLGIGARLVAIPYERLSHAADRDRWVLQGATKDSLQSLPAYNYEDGNRRG